jgi:hypothetical protein
MYQASMNLGYIPEPWDNPDIFHAYSVERSLWDLDRELANFRRYHLMLTGKVDAGYRPTQWNPEALRKRQLRTVNAILAWIEAEARKKTDDQARNARLYVGVLMERHEGLLAAGKVN